MPPNRTHRVTAFLRVVVIALVTVLSCTAGAVRGSAESTPSPTPIPNPFEEPVGGEQLGGAGVVQPEGDLPPVPDVTATSFVIADPTSRDVLAAKNAHESLEPGSAITMLMGLTLLDRVDINAVHEARARDVGVEGDRVGLQVGTEYTIDQLLYGLFLRSGNDAAAALAHAAGGADQLIGQMNQRAASLGAFDTQAAEATALESTEHRSSAYDLALIAAAGLEDEDFARYTGTVSYTLPRDDDATARPDVGTGSATKPPNDGSRIENDNDLLATYADASGVFADPATGSDPKTIVGVAERDGQRILVAVMRADAPTRASTAAALLDWGFEVADSVGDPVGELVTPADVTDAAASPSDGPTTGDPEAGSTVAPTTESAPPQDSAFPFRPLGLDPPQLMLVGLAAVFIVLAGTRVRTVVRERRRAGGSAAAKPTPGH